MGSEGTKTLTFHVTGFKKFNGVAENPTETIVNDLMNFVQKRRLPAGVTLGSCTILDVAGEGAVPMLYKLLESGNAATGSTNEQVIWIHLGVDPGAKNYALERQAVNEATFCCPDELGWQPQRVPVVSDDREISRRRQTCCSVEKILKCLKENGYDVAISNDAGRFVCNYVYYHSLMLAEKRGHKCLFVHLPPFTRINEDAQMQFVASLLEAIASTC